jgi:hypothetical protein
VNDTGDYTPLKAELPVRVSTRGGWTVVEAPRVQPWGILVLEHE